MNQQLTAAMLPVPHDELMSLIAAAMDGDTEAAREAAKEIAIALDADGREPGKTAAKSVRVLIRQRGVRLSGS